MSYKTRNRVYRASTAVALACCATGIASVFLPSLLAALNVVGLLILGVIALAALVVSVAVGV